MASGIPTHEQLSRHLVTKASKDDAFRQQLIANPHATIDRELTATYPQVGKIPANIKINVVEQSPANVYIVLPAKSSRPKSDELNDAELEAVAGAGTNKDTSCVDYGTDNC
ncbi:MAG: NHLP leader peptide family RiPP precursor [Verrucomicrobiota bacterium]